jgi:uncharacterized protein YegP (UPF0339 family)
MEVVEKLAKDNKHRWLMRSSNGSRWFTTERYTYHQIRSFQCASAIRPMSQTEERKVN